MTASEDLPTGWLPYVQVADVDASAKRAFELGATLVKARTQGPAGDFIVIQDPAGGTVALWESQ